MISMTGRNNVINGYIKKIEKLTGRKVLCNKPYSGTIIPNKYFNKNDARIKSIMIEINKRTYLNNNNDFLKLKRCINDYYIKIQKL